MRKIYCIKNKPKSNMNEQDLFMKHKCPCNSNFLKKCDLAIKTLTLTDGLNLSTTERSYSKEFTSKI